MLFQSPGPIALDLGFASIRWYGLMTAIAAMSCMWLGEKILAKRLAADSNQGVQSNLTTEDFSNFAIIAVISGIIGARLWFVFLNLEYFLENPSEIFMIWHGGQSIHGAIVGSILGTWLYCFFMKQSSSYLLQISTAAIVTPLGQAIGRWGNFFNGEAYGTETTLPWGLYIEQTERFHHPTFLYEAIWDLFLFGVLLKLYSRLTHLQIIGVYFFGYSVGRMFIEEIRVDSLMLLGIPAASFISYIGIALGILLYFEPKFNKVKALARK